jgi:hypothetical protein
MKKIAVITIAFCIIFLLQIPNVFAQNESTVREIDWIENGTNYQKIYYKDGTVAMFVTASATLNIESQSYASYSVFVPTPPFSFPLKEILELLKKIFDNIFGQIGIGCTLLAWVIWNRIKGLRRNRPKDYDGIERVF